MRISPWFIALAPIGALTAGDCAHAQTGGGFDLSWSTLDGGGARSSGGSFELAGAIGQPDAGRHFAGAFTFSGGYWLADAAPCRVDWNQDGFLNSQDFFDFVAVFFQLSADFNFDGLTNSQDFFDFLSAFFEGC